ncbi:hypothetical protein ACFQX6_67530 [Streptosporangium lutulentum]
MDSPTWRRGETTWQGTLWYASCGQQICIPHGFLEERVGWHQVETASHAFACVELGLPFTTPPQALIRLLTIAQSSDQAVAELAQKGHPELTCQLLSTIVARTGKQLDPDDTPTAEFRAITIDDGRSKRGDRVRAALSAWHAVAPESADDCEGVGHRAEMMLADVLHLLADEDSEVAEVIISAVGLFIEERTRQEPRSEHWNLTSFGAELIGELIGAVNHQGGPAHQMLGTALLNAT